MLLPSANGCIVDVNLALGELEETCALRCVSRECPAQEFDGRLVLE